MADLLLKSVPLVLDFLDIDNEEILESGILDNDEYDDDIVAVIIHTMNQRSETDLTKYPKLRRTRLGPDTSCSDEEFRRLFRMKRELFTNLLSFLESQNEGRLSTNQTGRPELSTELRLCLTLHYLGSRKTMRQLAKIYHVSESSVLISVRKIVSSFYQSMQSFIKWPDSNKQLEIADGFNKMTGMPRVVGVIDTAHVQVRAPHGQKDYYTNPRGKLSIILQAVCDHKMRFLHCCTGWPGFLDDASVFHDSDLYMDVTKDQTKFFPTGHYLVADSAYPLQDWLLTPFEDDNALNDEQRQFNEKHKVTGEIILNALIDLRVRFPRLQYIDMVEMEDIVKVILVCCALHNFCHEAGDNEVFSENDGNEIEDLDMLTESDLISQKEEGKERRIEIANILSVQQTQQS